MSPFSKTIAASLLALSPMIASGTAHATAPNFPSAAVLKINSDGFRACKALGGNGYTATARGVLGDGGGGDRSSGFRAFQIRTCFESRAQCVRFVDRIHHRVSQIEQLYHIGCKSRA